MSNVPGRCSQCRRILFPDDAGKIPAHRIPPPVGRVVDSDVYGSAPLTSSGAPWCQGTGEWARKRDSDTLTGDTYREHINRRQRKRRNGSR